MAEQEILEPIKCAPEEFPHSEEVPDGCIVLEDCKDHYGLLVDRKEVVYCSRKTSEENCDLKLIIYEPKDEKNPERNYPVIVFCQGSAFHKQWLNNHMHQEVRMAAKGYVVFVVEYRPSEIAPFPAQTIDCKTAIRYVKQHAQEYHGDPSRIALWGDSSGGHTVVMSAVSGDNEFQAEDDPDISCEVNCVVDWYGPMDFIAMSYYPSTQNHYDPDSPEGYELGHVNVLDNPEKNAEASPLTYIKEERSLPPFLIMHGGRDMLVPFNQSCRLYEKLKENHKEVTFYKLDQANHGFHGFNDDRILDLVDSFIQKHI